MSPQYSPLLISVLVNDLKLITRKKKLFFIGSFGINGKKSMQSCFVRCVWSLLFARQLCVDEGVSQGDPKFLRDDALMGFRKSL